MYFVVVFVLLAATAALILWLRHDERRKGGLANAASVFVGGASILGSDTPMLTAPGVRPLTKGFRAKGGVNPFPSQIIDRPAPPAAMNPRRSRTRKSSTPKKKAKSTKRKTRGRK